MKTWTIKVTERHSDVVEVKAETEEDAIAIAISEADCQYECLLDAEVIIGGES